MESITRSHDCWVNPQLSLAFALSRSVVRLTDPVRLDSQITTRNISLNDTKDAASALRLRRFSWSFARGESGFLKNRRLRTI